ncbi:hypothetical protein GCM10010425_54680 [Streptomyces spororaveus]|uniref:Uncharacterized protein n=1 Tax=Streptomyces spororaveus TaxID=284039 RepID=A0ABQ3TA95_9ACTN|nr:hypothetical protein Sspor_28950 [Streptomyces spororaveus]
MAATTAQQQVAKLFMPPWPQPPANCERCQKWAKVRVLAKGPCRGTVVSDMNVLMRRHAARGHA